MKLSACLRSDIDVALESMQNSNSAIEPIGDHGFYIKRINKEVFFFDANDVAICLVFTFQD